MRILSGLTPSASGVHLGNYFGAIREWIALQEDPKNEAFYFIADYHGLISTRDRKVLASNVREVAYDYLALGLDPERAVLYRQSDIPEVCELTWILTTLVPVSLLEKCHAYKDKTAQGISADHGLFAYPVLMAADILMPRANLVPVGQDQKQHVEVTRDIAGKFNQCYGDIFPLPDPYIPKDTAKIPGIDGRKMSKSYNNDIKVFDTEKRIRKACNRIVTDSLPVEAPKDPEANIVVELYKLMASSAQVESLSEKLRAGGYGYGEAKQELFTAFMDMFGAARSKREQLCAKPDYVEDVLKTGAAKVQELAKETLSMVRELTGLSSRMC